MKKIKPLHIVLIVVIGLELITLGIMFGLKHTNNTNKAETFDVTETVFGPSYTGETFASVLNDEAFHLSYADAYQCYNHEDSFKETFGINANWEDYKTLLNNKAFMMFQSQTEALTVAKDVAINSYNVPYQFFASDAGLYTITATADAKPIQNLLDEYAQTEGITTIALPAVVTYEDNTNDTACFFACIGTDGKAYITVYFGDEPLGNFEEANIAVGIFEPNTTNIVSGFVMSHATLITSPEEEYLYKIYQKVRP